MTRFKRNGHKPINNPPVKQEPKTHPGKIKMNGNWLTYNQKLFCDEWLKDRNATRAYKVAYPSVKNENSAASAGSQLLRNLKIDKYIQGKLAIISKKVEVDTEWVIRRYKLLADYCISDFFNDDGTMKPFSEIPREALYAIGGFKQSKRVINSKDEEYITERIKEFKLPSKRMVLDSLGKHLGMFQRDDDSNKGGISIENAQININLVD